MYVALSRQCQKKSIEKIHFIGNYFSSAITTNQDAHVEYERLPRNSLLKPLPLPNITEITMFL